MEGAVEAVERPLAACAYEKTGGAGVPSGLDEVELIVNLGRGWKISLSSAERGIFPHHTNI